MVKLPPILIATFLSMFMTFAGNAQEIGRSTGLELPRFVSIKGAEANVRRGPSTDHRIDWQYQARGLPLRVVAEYDNWRRVEDHEGFGGWIHYALLSGQRTVLVIAEQITLRESPDPDARPVAYAEQNVIARFEQCDNAWCQIEAGDRLGWTEASGLWGVNP